MDWKLRTNIGIPIFIATILAGSEIAPLICHLEQCHTEQPHTHQESVSVKDMRFVTVSGFSSTISAAIYPSDLM